MNPLPLSKGENRDIDSESIPLSSIVKVLDEKMPKHHSFSAQAWSLDWVRYEKEKDDRAAANR